MKIGAVMTLIGLSLLPLPARAGVVEITLTLAESESHACEATFTDAYKAVYRSKRDVVVWNIKNFCPEPKRIRVCVNGKPLRKCQGDPENASLDGKFTISGGSATDPTSATVACHIKWKVLEPCDKPRKYEVKALSGPADKDIGCPCTKPGQACEMGSELVLEVDP